MKEYRLGPRFLKYRNLCCILAAIVVFVFYFIYDYVFSAAVQWWDSRLMAFIFLLIGIAVLAIIWVGANKIRQNVSYTVAEEVLVCTSWKQNTSYPFRNFRKAYLGVVTFSSPIPVTFELEDGRTLRLNQYIGDLSGLTAQMLIKVAPFAQIDPQLKEYIDGSSALIL